MLIDRLIRTGKIAVLAVEPRIEVGARSRKCTIRHKAAWWLRRFGINFVIAQPPPGKLEPIFVDAQSHLQEVRLIGNIVVIVQSRGTVVRAKPDMISRISSRPGNPEKPLVGNGCRPGNSGIGHWRLPVPVGPIDTNLSIEMSVVPPPPNGIESTVVHAQGRSINGRLPWDRGSPLERTVATTDTGSPPTDPNTIGGVVGEPGKVNAIVETGHCTRARAGVGEAGKLWNSYIKLCNLQLVL